MFFYLFVCFWHFAALHLRAPSADRRETFTHDWKCVNLDNADTKIGGGGESPEKWGATAFSPYRPQISELPRPIAVKFCQVTGDIGGASKVS